MSLIFSRIDDTRYDFITETSLRDEIIKSGRKKIVFVEGYDDKVVFDILFSEHLQELSFIDVSLAEAKIVIDEKIGTGGCEVVKALLKNCVSSIFHEKRFYGVVDRDLNTDEELEIEKQDPVYDGRLFVFSERYTLENYFSTLDILYQFVKGRSANEKKLIKISTWTKNKFQQDILDPIESLLEYIGAANLTIKYFNDLKPVGEERVANLRQNIKFQEIEASVIEKVHNPSSSETREKLESFKQFVGTSRINAHKFANAKTYFSYNFEIQVKNICGVSLSINRHKSELARIMKGYGLPNDFKNLLFFLSVESN